jgi:hypothetical protein
MLEELRGVGDRIKAGGAGAFMERVLGVGWERNGETHAGYLSFNSSRAVEVNE